MLGASGIGKTRELHHLAELDRQRGMTCGRDDSLR
jgi:hypothetical protein